MRLAVIGSRDFNDQALFISTLAKVKTAITVIVSGGAIGADSMARDYAYGKGIEYKEYLPAWKQPWWKAGYDKTTAAAIRNAQIVEASDNVLVFWNGDEKSGTAQAIRIAQQLQKTIHIVRF